MIRNTNPWNCQRRRNKLPIGFVVASLLLAFGSLSMAPAATIPFTFALTFDTFVDGGPPSASTLTLPTTVQGTGSFAPLEVPVTRKQEQSRTQCYLRESLSLHVHGDRHCTLWRNHLY